MRRECNQSFWKFASHILDKDDSDSFVHPSFDADTAEKYFKEIYNSPNHHYFKPSWLPSTAAPHMSFDSDNIQLEEIISAINHSRSSSAPSPLDQIPYQILKRCPSLLPALASVFSLCWQTSTVPRAWKIANIILIPKKSAADNPGNPKHFRPIALTSCVGKIFTSIMKTMLHFHMISNNYLDSSIQKAFQPKVPGCIEHYSALSAAINEAINHHKALTVCWLDLANAFGSVHHDLIAFTLHHYHLPNQFIKLVENLYTDLVASVSTSTWSTDAIPLKIGVFQGDPLSSEIFNMVMNTYVDAIKPQIPTLGYHFSNSNQTLGLLQYADDSCLVSNGPSSCNQFLRITEAWMKWSGLKPAVNKCQCVSLESSSDHVVDPNLSLIGDKIPFVGREPVHFLGGTIQIPSSQQLAKDHIFLKISRLLSRVDATPITRKQKLRLYRLGICLRITWDLTISEFPLSWLEKNIDSLVTRYLKRWSGLARPADPSRLYLPQKNGGLGLSSVSMLYQKMQMSIASVLMTSRDHCIQLVSRLQLQKETLSQRRKFKPVTLIQEIFKNIPEASRKVLTRKARNEVHCQDVQKKLSHATNLRV